MKMTSVKFLGASVPAAVAPGLVAVFIPSSVGSRYAQFMEPLLLLGGGLIAFWVAPMYRKDMKWAFICLASFLVLYSPVFSNYLVGLFADATGRHFFRALLAYQILDYSFLIATCLFILRVIGIQGLSIWGWAFVISAATLVVGVVVSVFPSPEVFNGSDDIADLVLVISIFDAAVIVSLMPVIWLYVSKARTGYQESLTFMVIGGGVILSLGLVYAYALAKPRSFFEVIASEARTGSALDSLYIFGFVILAAALYAHRKHQEWEFARLSDRLV